VHKRPKRLIHCHQIVNGWLHRVCKNHSDITEPSGFEIIRRDQEYTVEDQANNTQQCKTERCIEQERQQ
jgi:hypothetical protein